MRVGLLVNGGCFASGLTALLDVLNVADDVRGQIDQCIPRIEAVILGPPGRVQIGPRLSVTTDRAIDELSDLEVLVAPALGTMTGPDTEAALESDCGRGIVTALHSLDPARTRVAAACTGVFPLAEAGLLDGLRGTTSWFLAPTFRRRYTAVGLDLDSMVVIDGPAVTAGAAFAHIDLALTLVRGLSAGLARQVARLLIIDERPSPAAYVAYDRLAHDDRVVLELERLSRAHLAEPVVVAAAARAIGVTRRTLERKTKQA